MKKIIVMLLLLTALLLTVSCESTDTQGTGSSTGVSVDSSQAGGSGTDNGSSDNSSSSNSSGSTVDSSSTSADTGTSDVGDENNGSDVGEPTERAFKVYLEFNGSPFVSTGDKPIIAVWNDGLSVVEAEVNENDVRYKN